jgi:hypothetical protein
MATKAPSAKVAQHDREIAAIRKLILAGMKMIAGVQKTQKQTDRQLLKLAGEHSETQKELRLLATEQRETKKLLQGLIRSLDRGHNGRAHS